MKTFLSMIVLIIIGVVIAYFVVNTGNDMAMVDEEPAMEEVETASTTDTEPEPDPEPIAHACSGIEVDTPVDGSVDVVFPLTVSGTIHPEGTVAGEWVVFEAVAGSMVVQDQNGNVASDTIRIDLETDWMNLNPKPFSVTIPELTAQPYSTAINLIITDSNQADVEELVTSPCVINLELEEEYYLSL